jgi:hypothetical protein
MWTFVWNGCSILKNLTSGKCLLILDGRMSHCFLEALHYCRQQHIGMLYLPPHTTHALQPLDRTVYQPLNSYYHQEATAYMHNHPQASINKSSFGMLYSAATSRALNVFTWTGLYPYYPNVIADEKFLPSIHFTKDKERESCRPISETPEQSEMAVKRTTASVQDHCVWDVPSGRHGFQRNHTELTETGQKARKETRTNPFNVWQQF